MNMQTVAMLEQLQQLFAQSKSGLRLQVTDAAGQPLIHCTPSGCGNSELARSCSLAAAVREAIQAFRGQREPIVIDAPDGGKWMIRPIGVQEAIRGFAIGEWRHPGQPDREGRAEGLAQLERFAELAGAVLEVGRLRQETAACSSFIDSLSRLIEVRRDTVAEVMESWLPLAEGAELIGFARHQENGTYLLEELLGQGAERLKGIVVEPGESFIGHAAITGQSGCWGQADEDARADLFRRCGVFPKTVACFPVERDGEAYLVLFALSTKAEGLTRQAILFGQVAARMAGAHASHLAMLEQTARQRMRFSVFFELCRTLYTMRDTRKISHLLTDVCCSLVRGAFACLAVRGRQSDTLKLTVKGIGDAEIRPYIKDLQRRQFAGDCPDGSFQETPWGAPVLEVPLYAFGVKCGVLAIGFPGTREMLELGDYFQAIGLAGGFALQQAAEAEGAGGQGTSGQPPALAEWTQRLIALVQELGETIPGSGEDSASLVEACRYTVYRPQVWASMEMPFSVQRLLIEFQSVLVGEPAGGEAWRRIEGPSIPAQLLAAAYVLAEEGPVALERLSGLSQEVQEACRRHISMRETRDWEWDMSSGDGQLAAGRDVGNVQLLPERLGLTDREKDVLRLMIEGYSNPQIGERLFISVHTVKNHMTRIYTKLGVADRSQAIAKVYRAEC